MQGSMSAYLSIGEDIVRRSVLCANMPDGDDVFTTHHRGTIGILSGARRRIQHAMMAEIAWQGAGYLPRLQGGIRVHTRRYALGPSGANAELSWSAFCGVGGRPCGAQTAKQAAVSFAFSAMARPVRGKPPLWSMTCARLWSLPVMFVCITINMAWATL